MQRTIRVNVVGNTGSAVPPLNLNLSERFFKQYPEPVRLDDGNSGLDAQGSRQETHSIIPVYPGEATLPPLKLTWWDSVNERVQEAVLPGRTLRITGEAPADQEFEDEASVREPQRSEPDQRGERPTGSPPGSGHPIVRQRHLSRLAVGAHRRRIPRLDCYLAVHAPPPQTGPALAPAPPDAAATAWKALNQACKTGRMEAMRNAWLKYLSAHWQLSAASTLARVRRTPKARELLERLNRALYASDPSGEISGQELLSATRALIKEEQETEQTATPLSALNG